MPSLQNIFHYLAGVWMLMTGRREGLNHLDLSADGFWNSFWAIAVAFPVFLFWWATELGEYGLEALELSGRLSIVLRLAVSDLTSWILPLFLLVPVVRLAGCADRFAAIVVGSNWGSALINWLLLPVMILMRFMPDSTGIASILGLMLILVYVALAWRLFHGLIGGSKLQTTAIFGTLILSEILISVAMLELLGLPAIAS